MLLCRSYRVAPGASTKIRTLKTFNLRVKEQIEARQRFEAYLEATINNSLQFQTSQSLLAIIDFSMTNKLTIKTFVPGRGVDGERGSPTGSNCHIKPQLKMLAKYVRDAESGITSLIIEPDNHQNYTVFESNFRHKLTINLKLPALEEIQWMYKVNRLLRFI